MEKRKQINFDVFTLDIANESLFRSSEKIRLRPKTFALLQHLISNPGQLVTKDQLLNALWDDCNVGEEALKHCVVEIRKALNDSAEAPRFIETVHRRGYRFIGKTGRENVKSEVKDRGQAVNKLPLVGRASELMQLQHCLQKAMGGVRQVVLISGEQGIGKTSLVDAFLDTLSAEQSSDRLFEFPTQVWFSRGQCIKSHGAGEAYMPITEALTNLCRKPNRRRIVNILQQHAPMWLAQMPSLISVAQLQRLRHATMGTTRERMLREMADAFEALTADVSLVLVLEDLHWSDHSTLDFISYWAKRRTPSRLLLIGTYRPAEASADDHPLKIISQELQIHQQCQEMPLRFLNEAAVGEFLMRRFPEHRFPMEFGPWIHQRTGGNPLFMINVLDHLAARGYIALQYGHWVLNVTLDQAEMAAPPTIQQMIERQIENCSRQEQQMLKAGSIEGVEFSIAAVAAILGEKTGRIEALCQKLVKRHQFLQLAGIRQLPDGRQSACYKFVHALYQNVCYQLLPSDLSVKFHRHMAEHIEQMHGKQPGEVASRLALHFEHGQEYSRAIQYYQLAVDNANKRFAGHEASGLARRGMQLLRFLPDTSERIQHEMSLLIGLGAALTATQGLFAEEVRQAFVRAHELFWRLDQSRQKDANKLYFSALYGLWSYHWSHAEYAAAQDLAEQLLKLSLVDNDSTLQGQAHHSMGIILLDHGEFAAALDHLEKSTSILSRSCAALAKWKLGYPDQALKDIEATLANALETRHPEDCIFAYQGAARVHMARLESDKALERVQAAMALANHNGLQQQWIVPMRSIRGWALAKEGQLKKGVEQLRQALDAYRTIGDTNLRSMLAAMFAEALGDAGQIEEGLSAVEEALAAVHSTDMHHYEAEIYRLKGELLLKRILKEHKISGHENLQFQEAEDCFNLAINTARSQQAKSFELRAATSLARLLLRQNRQTEAREFLLNIYDWFTEGHSTRDLQSARKLLQTLKSGS